MALRYVNVSKLHSGDTFLVDENSLLSGCVVVRTRSVDAVTVDVSVMVPGQGQHSVRLSRDLDVWVHR